MRVCNKQFSAVGWLHCGSYRTSSASCGSDGEADINYATSAMNRWVQGYIVDHTLCPFAKKSDYRISAMYDRIFNSVIMV